MLGAVKFADHAHGDGARRNNGTSALGSGAIVRVQGGAKPRKAREQLLSVRRALELLADHPLLGRDAEDGRRELILLRGRDGYIAKYRWLPAEEIVLILAVRHHREAGYSDE